ncbi:MAG: hypothetical protein IKJ11_07465 [Clostridia bacterium]|nr:hypothetical protein [Clostridia bacterium]
MPCYVQLIYNPFSQAARLMINHAGFARQGSKIQKMVIHKPMSHWLEALTCGYLQWNGFLPELIAEINEIDVDMVFEGNREDYSLFSEAVHRQAAALTERGFDPVEIRLTHRERFTIGQLQDQMRTLRRGWNVPVSTQSLMFRRDRLDSRLKSEMSAEETVSLIEDYIDLIRQIQKAADEAERMKVIEMRRAWEALLSREDKQ